MRSTKRDGREEPATVPSFLGKGGALVVTRLDRTHVHEMAEAGHSPSQIARNLGEGKPTW